MIDHRCKVFKNMVPCTIVCSYWCLRGVCCFHTLGPRTPLQTVNDYTTCMASYPSRFEFSWTLLWEPQIVCTLLLLSHLQCQNYNTPIHLRILYSYHFVTFQSSVFSSTGARNISSWKTVITLYKYFRCIMNVSEAVALGSTSKNWKIRWK